MIREPTKLEYRPLTQEAREELADLRTFGAGLVERLLPGETLTQGPSDFDVLQKLTDHEAMHNANFGAWVSLGVAFGDALIPYIPGMAWHLATADKDTYAALKYKDTGLSIAAPAMLWKRLERGEPIDIQYLANELKIIVQDTDAPRLE